MNSKIVPALLGILALGTTPVWFWPERSTSTVSTSVSPVFGVETPAESIASLRIASWDEGSSAAKVIEVKRSAGAWLIPSHHDYPADGNAKVSKIAQTFIGLNRGRQVPGDAKRHEELGVLDPLDAASIGRKGVGKRVTLTDSTGKIVLDLIIGNRDETGQGQQFVRELGSNEVWTAKFDAWELSTSFIDFVEPDPFKIAKDDVRGLAISDYSVDEASGTVQTRSTTVLTRPEAGKDWAAEQLPADKRLAQAKAGEIINELGNIRLAGVRPYNKAWLQARGFYLTKQGLYGNEGSLAITTKDGLRYWLFFGEVAPDDAQDTSAERSASAAAVSGSKNRYVAVFVQYDEKSDTTLAEASATGAAVKKPTGKERAAKAQKRFEQFFYVITDDTFQKLRPKDDALYEAKPGEPMAGNTGKTNAQWLAENGARTGVVTTASGLQHEVLASGPADGLSPTADQQVEVRYKGALVDGTEFDATQGDATATFGVGGVIKGWTEALKLMRPGDKWKLAIPPDLGYGEAGSPPKIGANAILVFEVELVRVVK